MKKQSTPPVRPRNAAATRQAILESAKRAFARAGFHGVGVREIASEAGVTAMLVNRYFGSKEGLFAEVVTAAMAEPVILTPENLKSEGFAEAIAAKLVEITGKGSTPLEGFLIMLHSTGSERAAEIGRQQIEKGHQKSLASALSGRHAPERAALILAIVAGVQIMRQMIALPALADSAPRTLVNLLTPIFRQLVEGNSVPGTHR